MRTSPVVRSRSITRTLFAVSTGAAASALLLLSSTPATAGIAWGDATLKADDVRVQIDARGHALVTHRIGIHVAAKRFRAFVLDGIDDHAEPPLDEATAAGLDGPGWPVSLVDTKASPNDAPIEAFVEPAKEARRLRVHLGRDGVPRGDYVLELRYRVDLSAQGSFVRDGTRVRFTWEAPSWPEGYDSGHLVFVLPAAPTEPQIAIADVGGGPARPVDGAAIAELSRSASEDTISLTRPHVPHHDDTRWVLTFDPKATPELMSTLPIDLREKPSAPIGPPRDLRFWCMAGALASAIFALSFFAMRRRDADATRACMDRGLALRPLSTLGTSMRSSAFAASISTALLLSLSRRYLPAAGLLLVALAFSILRVPSAKVETRAAGRWLAMPRQAIPSRPRGPRAPFDVSTWLGRLVLFGVLGALIAGCALLARRHLDLAVVVAMHGLPLLMLFATGRTSQLPAELAFDAWPKLAPIARTLEKKHGSRLKIIGHVPRRSSEGEPSSSARRGVDEVRLRIDPTEIAASKGLLSIEIGCAIVAGLGASAMVPELLVRLRHGSLSAQAIDARIGRARASSTFATSLGRTTDETVVSIRPVLTGAGSLRRWVEWILRTAAEGEMRGGQTRREPKTLARPETVVARPEPPQTIASL